MFNISVKSVVFLGIKLPHIRHEALHRAALLRPVLVQECAQCRPLLPPTAAATAAAATTTAAAATAGKAAAVAPAAAPRVVLGRLLAVAPLQKVVHQSMTGAQY